MKFEALISDEGALERVLELDVPDGASVTEIEDALAIAMGEPPEFLRDVLMSEGDDPTGPTDLHGDARNLVRVSRVCIELHYEASDPVQRLVSPQLRWRVIHRWACNHFGVAQDACADLELREDREDGAALGERNRIGKFKGCKEVWLVHPGPEPYGSE